MVTTKLCRLRRWITVRHSPAHSIGRKCTVPAHSGGALGRQRQTQEANPVQIRHRQRQLSLPWSLNRSPLGTPFAHPAEAELARILTFYRVRWLYEPTSFVLRRDPDGRPIESFTPDFFLPDHRLYIELTTMRQALVTRKNRKLRQLREQFPGVTIKLLYRRDVERLLGSYEDGWRRPSGACLGPVVVDEAAIERRIGELAGDVAEWASDGSPISERKIAPLILGISHGGAAFQQRLESELVNLGLTFESDCVTVTRFRKLGGDRPVRLVQTPSCAISGRDILVISDVVSSGLSLGYVVDWLRRHGAADVQICAFFERAAARLIDLPVRFRGFEAPEEPLIGCGLGVRRVHRQLPFVATLVSQATRPV